MFRAPAGEMEGRLCKVCGKDPSLGLEPVVASRSMAAPHQGHKSSRGHGHEAHPHRSRRRRHFTAKLVIAWLIVTAAIFTGARWLWTGDKPGETPVVAEGSTDAPISAEDVEFLNQGTAPSSLALSRFLEARSPEERSQFVLKSMLTAPRMDRFYSQNTWLPLDPRQLTLKSRALLSLPDGKAIETQWTSPDGHLFDAVFLEEGGEWRLDWDHFARSSDYPWMMFLAGSGGDEGEFRLLARERLAKERKGEDTLSIVLYAPRFGFAGEIGPQSPELLVPRDSKNGRLLEAAFELARSGKRVFGVDLPIIDPSEFIRVRVKIRRADPQSETRFELVDLIAPHWYATDEPGVVISEDL
jgi:hypothetical protein